MALLVKAVCAVRQPIATLALKFLLGKPWESLRMHDPRLASKAIAELGVRMRMMQECISVLKPSQQVDGEGWFL